MKQSKMPNSTKVTLRPVELVGLSCASADNDLADLHLPAPPTPARGCRDQIALYDQWLLELEADSRTGPERI